MSWLLESKISRENLARVRFVLQEKKDVLYETCSHLPELVFSSSQETQKKVFIYNKMVPVKTFFRLENVFITLEDVCSLVN